MNVLENLHYTKTHEWVKEHKNIARVGISDFAQHELTDIVFVELPSKGAELTAGKQCAVVESVKTASDIYAPVSGKVVRINDKVADAPELLNHDPYGDGWLFEIEMSNAQELNNLLSAGEYQQLMA